MKLSAPHMGSMHILLDDIFGRLGVEYIKPPPTTSRTLELGAKHSPEFACIPLKYNVGNFIEALEAGADTLLIAGGHGPCRFGYYGIVQERILRDLGYEFEFIMLEPFGDGPWSFYKTFERMSPGLSVRGLWKVLKASFRKARALDRVNKRALETRCYELKQGDTSKALSRAERKLSKAHAMEDIVAAEAEAIALFDAIPQDRDRDVLKVGIAGEFFLLLEPFSNFDMEELLGHKGVYIERTVWATDWIAPNRHNHIYGFPKDLVDAKAKPYLSHNVGGEGRETIGGIVLFAERGFDGIVQLLPFGCMPENIATSIIPRVQEEHDIPVLTLAFDEQTGRAGVSTRIEAYLDLLNSRRKSRELALAATK